LSYKNFYERSNFPKRIDKNIDFSNYPDSSAYTHFFKMIIKEYSKQDYVLDQSKKKHGTREIIYKCRGHFETGPESCFMKRLFM
jgi:hypothetical protein